MSSSQQAVTQHFLPTSLRAAIIASSYWVLSLSVTVFSGSMAAVLGCLCACYFVDLTINHSPLKKLNLVSISIACFGLLGLGLSVATLFTSTTVLANLLSPISAFNTAEFIKWFSVSSAITVFMRVLAHRTSFGAVVEIILVATAFVITLSAHRNGMIHRPFFIGDFALTRGIDPSSILMMFGCGAVLSLSALLMIESNQRRLPYHFTVLGLLCFSLLIYVRMFGLPSPQLTDGLNLTGSELDGTGSQNDNPFRDSANDTDDKEAPVAVVVFRDDYEPTGGSYYFRESAYSQFNGTMLDFTSRPDMDQDLIAHFTNDEVSSKQLPGATDQRSPVRATIGMLVAHRTPFGLDSPVSYKNTPNPNNLRFKRTYDAYSLVPDFDLNYLFGREAGRDDWSDEVRQEYLRLPDDPRYKDLAESLISDLRPEYTNDAFAKAWIVKSYLDQNGIYSLKNEHAYEADPAGSFLFGDLTGYCMHFSFAATYMFRSLGIPARVGIGYSVPAANRAGGSSLLIQAIHGHAWPEVYFEDVGWVIIDPAPQQTLVDMTTDPQDGLQQLLGDMLRDETSFDDFLQSQQTSFLDIDALLRIVYSLLAIIICSAYLAKLYRLWIPLGATPDKQYRLSYRAMLDKLSGIGLQRRFGESREQFALRVQDIAPSFIPLTHQHLATALGNAPTQEVSNDTWRSMRHAVDGEIKQNAVSWRKLNAALNPFSWLFTK